MLIVPSETKNKNACIHIQVVMSKININEPHWDQNTYWGRAKHFFTTTNPLNLFCGSSELERAKDIVTKCRKGEKLDINEDQIWQAKHLYDSAFHPDTGEKMILIGRMSAQVPMNMTITGCMLAFYKTTPQVVFWQWINQSFNAVVNYTNRSGDSPIPVKQLGISYALATSGALVTALGLNSLVKSAPPLIGRFVPFCAVAAANCVNIPMMRLKEIREGIPVVDKNGNRIGCSQTAAKWAITQVVLSRIGMAMPGMLIPPFIMNYLDKKGVLKKFPWINAPLQVGLCGLFLVFATPLCCALFPQQSSISVDSLEPEIRDVVIKLKLQDKCLYYNKGL
ncbi:sideroflexin-1 [Trichonephila inaurata madagascariensis]|uniref:Sidoreflexin n=1 Tax=Trichonephila inaurata madagascariensis TaxID=2747483 RepID=A0A8X6M9I3_9ARAC|nr:sideroflexin-1 [Trichonephila inaurata madagascariensis]